MAGEYARLLLASQQFHRFYLHQFTPFMSRTGLTMREIHILLFLSGNTERDTARDICLLQGLSKSQVSQGVELLATAGLLNRTPDQKDRRVIHLSLSESGLPLAEECQSIQKSCTRRLLNGLSPEETAQFQSLMDLILRNSEQLAREVPV